MQNMKIYFNTCYESRETNLKILSNDVEILEHVFKHVTRP